MQTFAIAPAGPSPWLLLVVLVPIALAITVLAVTLTGARRASFEISPEGLRLRGDFYGRLIPGAELRAAEARRVDFDAMPDLLPRRRTLGTGLPGYQAGWFRLQNGERALLYLTDRRKAIHVPTTAGYSLLVSPDDPEAFLRALRQSRTSG